jgi:hypothetical protein
MIHARTRAADYGARDVEAFSDHAPPVAGGRPLIIATRPGGAGSTSTPLVANGSAG